MMEMAAFAYERSMEVGYMQTTMTKAGEQRRPTNDDE